ncbi:MAG: hypothetical protein MJA31_10585 [Clostridia bacterium]|nr:hypothetical protein [Clostridia bacterium]
MAKPVLLSEIVVINTNMLGIVYSTIQLVSMCITQRGIIGPCAYINTNTTGI